MTDSAETNVDRFRKEVERHKRNSERRLAYYAKLDAPGLEVQAIADAAGCESILGILHTTGDLPMLDLSTHLELRQLDALCRMLVTIGWVPDPQWSYDQENHYRRLGFVKDGVRLGVFNFLTRANECRFVKTGSHLVDDYKLECSDGTAVPDAQDYARRLAERHNLLEVTDV